MKQNINFCRLNFFAKIEVHCNSGTVGALKNAHRKLGTSNDQR